MRLGTDRLRMFLLGTGVTLAFVGGSGVIAAHYLGVVTSDHRAEVQLVTVGDSLGIGSDVKFRGLRVGRVLAVTPGEHPTAAVVITHEYVDDIPAGVRARLLPGTLFGNEYVDLVAPVGAAASATVGDLDVIPADTSAKTLRLMDTLESTQRLLVAVDPGRLDAAVSAVAAALDGRGDDLSRFFADGAALVDEWQRQLPTLERDLDLLATDLGVLGDLEPDLVAAVRSTVPLARTVVSHEQAIVRLIRDGNDVLVTGREWLDRNLPTVVGTLRGVAATLVKFSDRQDSFELLMSKVLPVVENGANAVEGNEIQMNAALGLDFPDAYGPDDCPRYGPLSGPGCPGGAR
ncbi:MULTISPECIES: MCE family protein [unclassified Nocardioides]|uniref:MCE family protein n=1 Tax=unclassified Nocardioides TaxID=2615069 RepID=UPI0036222B2C